MLKALDDVGPRLRKLDGEVELVGIRDGAVQLRLRTSGHACGSTTKNLKAIVEEAHLRSGAGLDVARDSRTGGVCLRLRASGRIC